MTSPIEMAQLLHDQALDYCLAECGTCYRFLSANCPKEEEGSGPSADSSPCALFHRHISYINHGNHLLHTAREFAIRRGLPVSADLNTLITATSTV